MEIRKRAPLTRALLRGIAWTAYGHRRLRRGAGDDPPPRERVSRIGLFVSMELLGGGVIVSAMSRTLRTLYPDAEILVIGERHRSGTLEGMFREHSWVDGLIICPERDRSTVRDWLAFYRSLRKRKLDLVVLSPNHSCSDSVWLYMCGIPHIVGCYLPKTWEKLDRIENAFLTERVTTRQIGEGPYRLLEFPQAYARTLLRRDDFRLDELLPYLRFRHEPLPGLPAEGPAVTLHPGGPEEKRWPVEKYAEIARRLVERHGASLFVIGGPPESVLAEEIARAVRGASPTARVRNCCGSTVNQTMSYVAGSTMYVGNNTGPVQIAVALGVPVVGVFREQDRWFSGPDAAGERHAVVSRPSLADLSVDEVWSTIELRWPAHPAAGAPALPRDLSLAVG